MNLNYCVIHDIFYSASLYPSCPMLGHGKGWSKRDLEQLVRLMKKFRADRIQEIETQKNLSETA